MVKYNFRIKQLEKMEIKVENLKNILEQSYHGDLEEITINSELNQIIDSLDMLDFYFNLEETYEIQIPDLDIEKLKTLGDIINYIVAKTK